MTRRLMMASLFGLLLALTSTPVLAVPRDACPNLPGLQKKIPEGMSILFHVSDPFTPVCVPAYPLE